MHTIKYIKLLADSDTRRLLVLINFGRLSSGLVPFGLIALYTSRGEPAHAGIITFLFMLLSSATAPYKGRIISRFSPKKTVIPLSFTYTIITLAGLVFAHVSYNFLLSTALILIGILFAPPTQALVRAMWNEMSSTSAYNKALHALDSVTEELIFVITPIITAFFWATTNPIFSIVLGILAGLLANCGIISLGCKKSKYRHLVYNKQKVHAYDSFSLYPQKHLYFNKITFGLLAPLFGLGFTMGSLSIILPTWTGKYIGSEAASGVLIGLISLAGFIAGIFYGKINFKNIKNNRQYQILSALLACGILIFFPAQNIYISFISMLLIGTAMTPMFISSYTLVDKYYDSTRHTEINAALGSSFNIGSGIATLYAGLSLTFLETNAALFTTLIIVLLAACISLNLP